MRLISMDLQNFRQHERSFISFGPGLTGIVGTNGSGKSTILEGLAFGFYGTVAARGVKDGIKWNRAGAKASVRVEIEFALAGHHYRVVRGLSMAELYQDSGASPIANSLSGVSDQMQRILGMTKDEFFMTYFTAQKDLNAMSALGPTERAKFLSRALGFDRIAAAQEFARERRRQLVAETNGLQLAMPDIAVVERAIAEAEERVVMATAARDRALDTREGALTRHLLAEPALNASLAKRERDQAVASELRVLDAGLDGVRITVNSLDAQMHAIDGAQVEHDALRADVVILPEMRARLAELDALAAEHSAAQQAIGTVASLHQQIERVQLQLTAINLIDGQLQELLENVNAAMSAANVANAERESAKQTWFQQRSDAQSALQRLRDQHSALKKQRDELLAKGADGHCSACGQSLGASWQNALAKLDADIVVVVADGTTAKTAVEKQVTVPAALADAELKAEAAARAMTTADQFFQAERNRARDHDRLTLELAELRQQRAKASVSLNDIMQTYDAQAHASLRNDVAARSQKETRMAVLAATIDRREQVLFELNAATTRQGELTAQQSTLASERAALRFDEAVHQQIVREYELASTAARNADIDATVADGESNRAKQALEFARKQREDTAIARAKLVELEVDRLRHEELERQFTVLRAELNAKLRPELAEIASALLDVLTDGRYSEASFDENYVLTLMDDGVAKGVISGGEEDLCNLVLRLAISQMIAARAGHAFSLLILDEVFGSLDDTRRENVMALLRGLNDRFEQVIVISHIGQIRDGLDNVIQVQFDADLGSSVVTNGDGTTMQRKGDALLMVAA